MIKLFSAFVITILFLSCSSIKKFDETVEKQKIMKLHNFQQEYHLKNMPEKFVSLFSKSFVSVNKGKISSPSYSESLKRFKNYFNSVEFVKWDDIKPPVIRFSDDGSMAYSIVNKEVILRDKNNKERNTEEKTIFSWVTIYKKYGNDWKIDCVASTNEPEEITQN
ncbi:MAG TPA: hypothetical protein VKA26_11345 [Ignavibacteriaceae bacterium]|nr:hypothetical protein [Ignavibacteriaceae bacterium]